MGNGFPPTSGQIPPTSGYFDWLKWDPHIAYTIRIFEREPQTLSLLKMMYYILPLFGLCHLFIKSYI